MGEIVFELNLTLILILKTHLQLVNVLKARTLRKTRKFCAQNVSEIPIYTFISLLLEQTSHKCNITRSPYKTTLYLARNHLTPFNHVAKRVN
jgi:hypothetical protein